MTEHDPALAELIAAHYPGPPNPFAGVNRIKKVSCECGESMPATDHPAHVASMVKQYADGQTAELRATTEHWRTCAMRSEAAITRLTRAAFASDDGTEYEHNPGCGGEAECPACWAETIRMATEGTNAWPK